MNKVQMIFNSIAAALGAAVGFLFGEVTERKSHDQYTNNQ